MAAMRRKAAAVRLAATAIVVALACGGATAGPAPRPQLQPLLARFDAIEPGGGGYAAAYGYGGHAAPAVRVGTAVGGTAVHYADQPPTVVGYAPAAVYKPDLSAYAAAPWPQVEQLRRFDPVYRPVHTVVPKVTAVEPSVTVVHKTYADGPVVHGYGPVQPARAHDPPHYYDYQLIADR